MPSIHAHCQQREAATLPPSTITRGTRTPLWQVYTKTHAHDRDVGSRTVTVLLHACQRRCPHTTATASDSGSGSGSVRTNCEHAADGGEGRASGVRQQGGHSPGRLPAHPASAERINKHGPTLHPGGLLIMHACRQQRKSLNENHVLIASKRHENFLCTQLLSLPNPWKKSPCASPGVVRGTPSHRSYSTQLPPAQLVTF